MVRGDEPAHGDPIRPICESRGCIGECREHALWLNDPGAADSGAVCNEKGRNRLGYSVPPGAGGCSDFALTLRQGPRKDPRRRSGRGTPWNISSELDGWKAIAILATLRIEAERE